MAAQVFSIPTLPLKVLLPEAVEMIQEELEGNEWDVEPKPPALELRPYYVFHFDSFSEAEEEGSKIRNVDETTQGESALNAISNLLDEVIAESASPEMILNELSVPKDVKVNQKTPRFALDDAKIAAQIKIAAQEKVPKANVHIAGMRLVYVPFWIASIELEEDNKITLKINGVTGEFEGEESGVPFRGKTRGELLRETLGDLRSPGGWADYLKTFAEGVILLFQPNKEHPNRRLIIIILVLIALALLAIGFIKFPTPQ